jgi:hypothetical protein
MVPGLSSKLSTSSTRVFFYHQTNKPKFTQVARENMDESTGKAGDGVPTPVADGGAGGIVPMAEGSKKRSPNRLIVDEATNDDNRYA